MSLFVCCCQSFRLSLYKFPFVGVNAVSVPVKIWSALWNLGAVERFPKQAKSLLSTAVSKE